MFQVAFVFSVVVFQKSLVLLSKVPPLPVTSLFHFQSKVFTSDSAHASWFLLCACLFVYNWILQPSSLFV